MPTFTLKQLRYFDAALRNGSIARAAAEMNISQSSITAAIDGLEAVVGAPLFRRVPARGLTPTETGRAVGALVAEFLDRARLLEGELASFGGAPRGTLRIACYAPTAPHVLPPLLTRLSDAHPSIRVDLREGDMAEVAQFLATGAVDLALTYRRNLPTDRTFLGLVRCRPYALLPAGSPLAARKAVTLAELAPLPMVLLDLAATERYFLDIFRRAGLEPKVVHTTKSSSVLRGLVAANFGYSILNICGPADRRGDQGWVARPILGDLDEPQYGIAYSPGAERTALVRAVLRIGAQLAEEGTFAHLVMRPEG